MKMKVVDVIASGQIKERASAAATLGGIEVAQMIRKGQLKPGICPFKKFAELAA
nr:hypothetical protein [uncultured Ruegeria sp.]